MPNVQHDQDFFGWTHEQVAALRSGKLTELDVEHLIEEIESMGASERRELESRIKVLLNTFSNGNFSLTGDLAVGLGPSMNSETNWSCFCGKAPRFIASCLKASSVHIQRHGEMLRLKRGWWLADFQVHARTHRTRY